MIASFGDRATEDLYHGRPTARARRFPRDAVDAALVKMDSLNGAASTLDLRSPPGNRLEALQGRRAGQYSIRVNDQFRLCFRWTATGAEDVEIVDYH